MKSFNFANLFRRKNKTEAKDKAKKTDVIWMTKEMAENVSREIFLVTTLRELVLFSLFLLNLTFIALGMIYPSMYFLTQVMKQQFQETEFSNVYEKDITFDDIRSAADFWSYVETNFVQALYWDYWYSEESQIGPTEPHDKGILYENKLIGVPRIRQVKVRNDSCIIHPHFRRTFLVCYDKYSQLAKDKAPFGEGTGDAWTYHERTTSTKHFGKVATYDGGGYFQYLSSKSNKTIEILSKLKEGLWITRGTRCIFIDYTIYNANVNLFCCAKLVFEFPPTGGIIPTAYFYSVKLLRYVTLTDHIILACELIHLGFIVFYTAEEIREIIYLKFHYLQMFWSYIDFTIILTSYVYYILSTIKLIRVVKIMKNVVKKKDAYFSFSSIASLEMDIRNLLAVTLFLAYLKVFKYLSFNKTMGQLNNTLKKCARDVSGFSVMFLLIFVSFAELGFLIFGTQVQEFSSFGVAMFTLLRTILGDFDYTEIEKAHRILAPIYFLLFIFLVFFVLLNMFLAIINDTYADVKTELALAPDEMQMGEFLRRGFYNFLMYCGCKKCVKPITVNKNEYNVTSEEIRGALKKCGFNDLDIDMFFSRYNIDPEAVVGDYDISKLLQELLGKQSAVPKVGEKRKDDDNTPLVAMDDFIGQQERLDNIEKIMAEIAEKIDRLLEKLNTIENLNVKKHK